MVDALIEIIKFTVPALVVFFTSYYLLQTYLDNHYKQQLLELRHDNQDTILPLRLKAYERLSLFLERIAPNRLINRKDKSKMRARDLHLAMLNAIRNEFEHNLSQQIYVSPEAWEVVKAAKEEVVYIINDAASNVNPQDDSKVLSKALYEKILNRKKALPTQKALNKLKQEVQELY